MGHRQQSAGRHGNGRRRTVNILSVRLTPERARMSRIDTRDFTVQAREEHNTLICTGLEPCVCVWLRSRAEGLTARGAGGGKYFLVPPGF